MHPAILDIAGYILLLSGLITLVMLLRERCKRKKESPFYILSMSDVFSSIVTAIVLLASHIEDEVKFSYNWQNNINDTEIDHAWTIRNNSEYKLLFSRIHQLNGKTAREVDSNVTLTCNVKDVFMQYGMLLAPLTNALISLLTFAVQCNLNAMCVKRRCANLMKSSASRNTRLETKHVEIMRRGKGTSEDQQELASQGSNVSAKNANIVRKIMKIFQFQTAREHNKKSASFLVTSHWLVPFLVTAILCFAGYDDMNIVQRTKDTECIFESNFPVNFYVFSDAENNLNIVNSDVHKTPLESYYFVDEEALIKSNLSNEKVNQIVSKVQGIVENELSYIRSSTENTKATNPFDTSTLQNMTNYIVINNTSIENITGIDEARETQTTNDIITEQIINVYNLSSQTDNHTHFDPEMLLFHNLLKNISEESNITTLGSTSNVMQPSVQNKDTMNSYEGAKENTTDRTVDILISQDPTFISDDQIYADILKRIHAASVYTALKNHRNHSVDRPYDRKKPKRNNLEDYIARIKPNSIADLFFDKYDHFDRDINTETSGSSRMTNECLVSNEFLKLYLFVLSFAIYFLPILLCCILQVRGEHACENTLAILKAKIDLMSTLLDANYNDDDNVVIVNEGAHAEWLSTSSGSIGSKSSTDRFNKPLEIRDNHGSTIDVGTISTKHESYKKVQNRDMLLEVNCTARICRVVKVSLILCVLLWSPIFLGTLLKVFSCIHGPKWLTDTIFLSAISFGIIRNILNMYIIKIQELCTNDNAKENRICPVE